MIVYEGVLVIRVMELGSTIVIHVFYGFEDWEFSKEDYFVVVDYEGVDNVSQMVVCVMVRSFWTFVGIFIHLGMTKFDFGAHW